MKQEEGIDNPQHEGEQLQARDYLIMVHEVVHFWGRVRVRATTYEEATELARNDFVPDWSNWSGWDSEEMWEELIDVQEAKSL